MMLRAAFAALLIGLAAPASADDAAVVRTELDEAFDRLVDGGAQRWAFTMTLTTDGERYVARFDPRNAPQWELLAPSADDLDKDARKAFEELSSNAEADEQLVADDLPASLGAYELVSSDASKAVFRFELSPDAEDAPPKKFLKAMRCDVTLDRASRAVTEIRIHAIEPFKPAPVAKVTSMESVTTYVPRDGFPAPLAQSQRTTAKGSALMRKFEETSVIEFSDIIPVEAAPFSDDDAD